MKNPCDEIEIGIMDCEKQVKQAVAPMWINLETSHNRLRQISKLCRELVNELKDVYYILGEYREEYSKVYEIADEIENWLITENEE